MGFRISGPSNSTGLDRLASVYGEDEGFPGFHWFITGIEETDPAGNPVKDRLPGSLSITFDPASGMYRITLRDPASGSVAYRHVNCFATLVADVDGLLIQSSLTWQVDKYAKQSKITK